MGPYDTTSFVCPRDKSPRDTTDPHLSLSVFLLRSTHPRTRLPSSPPCATSYRTDGEIESPVSLVETLSPCTRLQTSSSSSVGTVLFVSCKVRLLVYGSGPLPLSCRPQFPLVLCRRTDLRPLAPPRAPLHPSRQGHPNHRPFPSSTNTVETPESPSPYRTPGTPYLLPVSVLPPSLKLLGPVSAPADRVGTVGTSPRLHNMSTT